MGLEIKGTKVNPGKVTGRVKIVKNISDLEKIQDGDIMVIEESNPIFSIGVLKASGLICETGGALTHLCIICSEINIPCMINAKDVTKILTENMHITLDASKSVIYEN